MTLWIVFRELPAGAVEAGDLKGAEKAARAIYGPTEPLRVVSAASLAVTMEEAETRRRHQALAARLKGYGSTED